MNKSELIYRVAAHFPQFTLDDSDCCVNLILREISSALAQGRRVEMRGFGRFELKYRSSHRGRNPWLGKAIVIPAGRKIHFKAGKALRSAIEDTAGQIPLPAKTRHRENNWSLRGKVGSFRNPPGGV